MEFNENLLQTSKQQLRQMLRAKRKSLSVELATRYSMAIKEQLLALPLLRHITKIAFYYPFQGEVDATLLQLALPPEKQSYLPRLAGELLTFHQLSSNSKLVKNQFGILEPTSEAPLLAAHALEVVLVPLVAFDAAGYRLGMGQGFYDKTFAFKNALFQKPPYLIGLAYEFQKVMKVPYNELDIRLDMIITEQKLYYPA